MLRPKHKDMLVYELRKYQLSASYVSHVIIPLEGEESNGTELEDRDTVHYSRPCMDRMWPSTY